MEDFEVKPKVKLKLSLQYVMLLLSFQLTCLFLCFNVPNIEGVDTEQECKE